MRETVTVWSGTVRAGHWALAGCVLVCLWFYEGGAWHEWLGRVALLLASWRATVGWLTLEPQLSFANFVRGPAATFAHARALFSGKRPRYLGHNPLGGWMIVALLAAAVLAGVSGTAYVMEDYWGDPLLRAVHQIAGWSFVVLVPLHVGGVVLTSILQRENLIAAMFTGRKRAPGPGETRAD